MSASETKTRLLLYGAYGYTGRLTAQLAADTNLYVILASRIRTALKKPGDRMGLPTRVISLDDSTHLADALEDVASVIHMGGPFAITSAPMLNACLATRTNYIDVTGEIEVLEAMWSRKQEIDRAGITFVPGAGFDVAPTDCLVGYVAAKFVP